MEKLLVSLVNCFSFAKFFFSNILISGVVVITSGFFLSFDHMLYFIPRKCQWETMCRHNIIMMNFNLTFLFRHSKHQMKFTTNKTSCTVYNFRLVMCVHFVVKITEFITCQE